MVEKVLIVDDRSVILDLVTDILDVEGYETFSTSDPKEAIQKLGDIRPDLVITDLCMPDIDGFVLARAVREACDASIIMLTGMWQSFHGTDEIELFDDYLEKPVQIDDLRNRVRQVLSKKKEWGIVVPIRNGIKICA